MKIVDKIFNFLIFMQFCLMLIFLIENFDNLNEIPFEFKFGQSSLTNFSFTVNFKLLLVLLGVIYGLVIVAGIQFVGTGFSEFSNNMFARIASLVVFYVILGVSSIYYIGIMGYVGTIIAFFITIIWIMKGFSMMNTSNDGVGY